MKGRCISYSEEELLFIKTNCTLPRVELHKKFCAQFKREELSKSNINSLCKRKGWMTGRTGCYEKGNIPHPNARPKGPNKTSFKKGSIPANKRPVGFERFSKDGYWEVKIAEGFGMYRLKHRVMYEKYHGKIPKGALIRFKDGDVNNFAEENLICITRAENVYLNQVDFNKTPEELKEVTLSLVKLQVKTNEINHTNKKKGNTMPKLYLEKTRTDAIVPAKATDDAACYDIHADLMGRKIKSYLSGSVIFGDPTIKNGILKLTPGERALVPTGWKMCCDPGWKIEIAPRSGNAIKKGLSLINCIGIIDSDYRDEVMLLIVNHSDWPVEVNHGERIAQLSLEKVNDIEMLIGLLPDTDSNRDGGMGSTDK